LSHLSCPAGLLQHAVGGCAHAGSSPHPTLCLHSLQQACKTNLYHSMLWQCCSLVRACTTRTALQLWDGQAVYQENSTQELKSSLQAVAFYQAYIGPIMDDHTRLTLPPGRYMIARSHTKISTRQQGLHHIQVSYTISIKGTTSYFIICNKHGYLHTHHSTGYPVRTAGPPCLLVCRTSHLVTVPHTWLLWSTCAACCVRTS
jgi:hypothetical protein